MSLLCHEMLENRKWSQQGLFSNCHFWKSLQIPFLASILKVVMMPPSHAHGEPRSIATTPQPPPPPHGMLVGNSFKQPFGTHLKGSEVSCLRKWHEEWMKQQNWRAKGKLLGHCLVSQFSHLLKKFNYLILK